MTLLKNIQNIPLAFGGASISGEGAGYGFGQIDEGEAVDLLKEAYELGLRIFDTAPIYGFGLSEQRIGRAFRQNRDKVFIVSKSGVTWHENKRVDMTNDPSVAAKMLDQSLIDLNSDYIDLYMVHWPDARVDIRKTLEVFDRALHAGKIKHVGLCNTNRIELNLALEVCPIEVVQSEFNFFERKLEPELFPFLNEKKISFMSWGTLDKGILTARVNRDRKFDQSDCRSWAPWWKSQDFSSKYDVMDRLKPIVEKNGYTLLEFALGFNLFVGGQFQDFLTPICGARNSEQLNSLVKSLGHLPNADVIGKMLASLERNLEKAED